MIWRTFDPVPVNTLLNHPSVRPAIGGEGPLDATDLIADRRNICLLSEGGGALFRWTGPRIYEGHSFFTIRGRKAIELGKALVGFIDADLLWGLTPKHLRHVRWFNRKIGMKSLGLQDTPDGICELFEMRY